MMWPRGATAPYQALKGIYRRPLEVSLGLRDGTDFVPRQVHRDTAAPQALRDTVLDALAYGLVRQKVKGASPARRVRALHLPRKTQDGMHDVERRAARSGGARRLVDTNRKLCCFRSSLSSITSAAHFEATCPSTRLPFRSSSWATRLVGASACRAASPDVVLAASSASSTAATPVVDDEMQRDVASLDRAGRALAETQRLPPAGHHRF